jgi:acyl-coenzyme A synthetase/AMP-(fatty) acid ligase
MKLLERLASHASQTRIAYREVGGQARELSYAELWRASNSFASKLSRINEQGAVIMLCLPNRIEYPLAFVATLIAGRSVFPISPESTPAELQSLANQTQTAAIIGTPRACAALKDQAITIPIEEVLTGDTKPIAPAAPGDLLLCSSGTTSQPKIVLRDAASLDAVATNTASAVGFNSDDRVLAIVPLCHSYGLEHGLLAPLWSASTIHLCDGLDLSSVIAQLTQSNITIFPSVPSVYEMLCQSAGGHPLPTLRKAYAAGAPLPPTIAAAFRKSTGVQISQLYGATEIGSVAYADPNSPHFDPQSVGTPFEGVNIRIIDPATQRSVPPDHEGEVHIAAPSMFRGYLNQTTPCKIDGYFPTGDLGKIDTHNNLTITGRLKLLIEVAGQKVNVLELESLLAQHPSVAEAAVVALRVSQTVSRLKAVVTPSDKAKPPEEKELRQFLRQRIAAYKIPRIIEVRDTLPRSPAGKILRRMLEES